MSRMVLMIENGQLNPKQTNMITSKMLNFTSDKFSPFYFDN